MKSVQFSLFSAFLLAVLFIANCTTKEGKILSFNPRYGNLLVTSTNFYGARIFLDYEDTGKLTPALLENVPVGRHIVHIFLSETKSSPDSQVVEVEKGREKTVQFKLNKVPSGDLSIATTPEGANIRINKLNFGFAPLQIVGLPEGEYRLQIWKSNYRPVEKNVQIVAAQIREVNETLTLTKMILLEHFSNVNCPPCPQADAIIDQLAEDYGVANLIVLGYHVGWPSPTDPFYLAAKADNDARLAFYPPGPVPQAFVNGEKVAQALDEQSYRTLIDAGLQEAATAVIEFRQVHRTDSLITGKIKITAVSDLPAGTVLQVALIEDAIDFDNPPGTNGQTHFESINRKFYPDAAGQTFTLSAGASQTSDFSFVLSNEWGRDLTVLAFLQDSGSRVVYQSAWTRFPPM